MFLFNSPELKEVRKNFIELHNRDLEKAKFKIGEKVLIKDFLCDEGEPPHFTAIIEAVNDTGDGIEYMLKNHGHLYWEDQLEEVKS